MADVYIETPVDGATGQYKFRLKDFSTYLAQVVALEPSDTTTGALLTIDTIHHEVHEGEMFHAEYTNTNVANNGSVDLLLTVGVKEAHFVFALNAGGQCLAYVYEAPTSTGGTAVAAYNMHRSIATAPLTTVTYAPTVTATGSTAIVDGRLLAGGNSVQTRIGGGVRTNTEWILKPSTKYLLRVTNTSGGAVAVNVALEWYEEAV